MIPIMYTNEQVIDYRNRHSCSLFESVAHHKQQNLLLHMRNAKKTGNVDYRFDMLFDIVEDLIMRAKF